MKPDAKTYLILPAIATAMAMVVTAVSCSTDGCLNNQNSLPLAGFYSSATHQAIYIDSVEIGGVDAPHDSLLHSPGSSISEVYLPFRSVTDSTSFYFHYAEKHLSNPDYNDTITFRYDSDPYFASEECGAMYRFIITKVKYTTHLIDSVAVEDSVVTNTDRQRIKIFMRTSSGEPTTQHLQAP